MFYLVGNTLGSSGKCLFLTVLSFWQLSYFWSLRPMEAFGFFIANFTQHLFIVQQREITTKISQFRLFLVENWSHSRWFHLSTSLVHFPGNHQLFLLFTLSFMAFTSLSPSTLIISHPLHPPTQFFHTSFCHFHTQQPLSRPILPIGARYCGILTKTRSFKTFSPRSLHLPTILHPLPPLFPPSDFNLPQHPSQPTHHSRTRQAGLVFQTITPSLF